MKILLVEDDLILAEEIVRLCRKWGFEAEYLEEFQAVDREYTKRQADLILMDINLPFYDGLLGKGDPETVPGAHSFPFQQGSEQRQSYGYGVRGRRLCGKTF